MDGLSNIHPAADFELVKTDELYAEIGQSCRNLEETILLYNKNYSYRAEKNVFREHMSFQHYLDERKRFLDEEDDASRAQRLAEYKSVDVFLEEMIETREANKLLFSSKQGLGELRPFQTTRVDKSASQAVQLVASGNKPSVHLDAGTLVRRHLPSKLLHRVSKLQRKLRQNAEEEEMLRQVEEEGLDGEPHLAWEGEGEGEGEGGGSQADE